MQKIVERGRRAAAEAEDLTPQIMEASREVGLDTSQTGFAHRDDMGRYYLGLDRPFFVRKHNNVSCPPTPSLDLFRI